MNRSMPNSGPSPSLLHEHMGSEHYPLRNAHYRPGHYPHQNGRLILTACTATETAWENEKLRNQLLTYHLIEALLGAGRGVGGR